MAERTVAAGTRTIAEMELRSDTFTLPTARMREAMFAAEVGDDCYGEDPTVRLLESRVAGLLGKEAACLVPSGTMGNLAAILAHCPRGSQVIVGVESDIFQCEAGGATVCGGVVYHPVPNRPDGTIEPSRIAAAFPRDPADPQFPPPALVCLENPQSRCGGSALPLSHLDEVAALTRELGVPLHLDGSRICNAAVATGVPADRIAACADSVQLCLSKGLGAPVGSVVAGSGPFISAVRRIRKMLGGGMRQAGVFAAAGLVALEDGQGRLADDHANARRLSGGLARIPGVTVERGGAPTNMVFFRVIHPDLTTGEFLARAARLGVRLMDVGGGRVRAVTHSGLGPDHIERALDVCRQVLSGEDGSR